MWKRAVERVIIVQKGVKRNESALCGERLNKCCLEGIFN